jgi:hypothetical protein
MEILNFIDGLSDSERVFAIISSVVIFCAMLTVFAWDE